MNSVRYPKVVFVCGVSGVGKTRLIRQVLPQLQEAVSWTASEIIGEARQNTDPEYLRTLPVNELARSQELLVRAFRDRVDAANAAIVLLDGHSVLDTNEGFFQIDTAIIRRLNPVTFIHIEEHVERIFERRGSDLRKPRPPRTIEQLHDYQDRSRAACRGYANALGRQMIQLYSEDSAGLHAVLGELQLNRSL
jgi:adenylate kinase